MINYESAGVNIDAGNEVVRRIKAPIKKTFDSNVLTELGGFAALYDLKSLIEEYAEPVLVQSIDGLGTKPMIASMMNQYDTLGDDLLSATANDILVCGAKPLTLLDYIGGAKIKPDEVVAIVESMSRACIENGVSLIGGETAEMPGVYAGRDYDIVGIITGVVDKSRVINGKNIQVGDCVLGFGSSGLHTNGYSLARKLCFDIAKLSLSEIGPTLLKPHLNYTRPVLSLIEKFPSIIKGMAHITGGGLLENIPRILPKHCSVELNLDSWPGLPIFELLRNLGKLTTFEAYRTFNMGIGYIMVVDPTEAKAILTTAQKLWPEFPLYSIGQVVLGNQEVILK
jgi:phosphoribosylformylglycinamidine cyclo-ligase